MKHFYLVMLAVVVLAFTTRNFPLSAQQAIIRGRIVDTETQLAVDFAGVLNYSRQTRTYSNSNGEFILAADRGDTLVLSAVGYFYEKIIVTDSLLRAHTTVEFLMKLQPYEIGEARIIGLGTYDQFRRDFIALDRPVTNTGKLADGLAEASHKEAREAYDMAKANQKLDGITLLSIPIRTPEEKERIALGKIMKQEEIRDKIYRKFNPEVIRKVTTLTKDDDIIEFMVFCDFPEKYLLEVDEYELMEQIALKFIAYKRKKDA